MFELISSMLKYLFTLIIYLFIFGISRLIYLDIKSLNARGAKADSAQPYLKLINQRENLDFRMEETYPVKERMRVGRHHENQIVLKDPFVSGKHAEFQRVNGKCVLKDLGSTNGTLLNGIRLQGNTEAGLKDGDKIEFGNVGFLFVENSAARKQGGEVE